MQSIRVEHNMVVVEILFDGWCSGCCKNHHRVFRINQKTYQTPETSNARQPNALKGHLMTTNALIDHKRSSKPTRLTALLPNRRISSLTTASTDVGVGAEVNIESQQNIEEHQLGKNDAKGQELQ